MLVASDDRAAQVEMSQVNFAEGPCLEVMSSFQPFYEPDLASPQARDRWPSFVASAMDNGVQAAFAFPLMTGGIAVGALDLYASSPGPLGAEEVENALMLAGLAAIAVDQNTGATEIADVGIGVEPAEPWAHSAVVHTQPVWCLSNWASTSTKRSSGSALLPSPPTVRWPMSPGP